MRLEKRIRKGLRSAWKSDRLDARNHSNRSPILSVQLVLTYEKQKLFRMYQSIILRFVAAPVEVIYVI